MKTRALILCVIAWTLLLPCKVLAQRGVEIEPIDGALIHTDPRNVLTSLFSVTNTSSERIEFIFELDLPEDWKIISKDFVFSLDPGQSQIRLLSFFVPQNAKAGSYEIPCIVRSRKHPSITDFFITRVQVQAITDISLQILNGPDSVIAGHEYQVDFVVINQSNQSVDIKTEAESRQGFLLNREQSLFHCNPGESKTGSITVFSNSDIKSKTTDQLFLTAKVIQAPETTAKAKHKVDIIPRVFNPRDIYHRLPVTLTFHQIANKDEDAWDTGFQAEISGKGFVDENKTKYLLFSAKAPDQSSIDLFGQYDEYKIQYYTGTYDLSAGDLSFDLSPLTEAGFSARGIEAIYRIDQFTLGGHTAKTRLAIDEEKQWGAYINFQTKNKNLFSLNYLSKSLKEDTYHIWSLNSDIKPLSDTKVFLEYAGSMGDHGKSRINKAFLAEILHNQDTLNIKFKSFYADPDFQGYRKDQKRISIAGSYEGNDKWRISADFVFDRKNLDLKENGLTAPQRKYYRLKCNYNLFQKMSFFMELIRENRKDRQIAPEFDFMENSARLGSNFSYDKLSFILAAEAGRTVNNLLDNRSSFQRYIFSANYNYSARFSGSGYISYDTSEAYEGLSRQKLTYGLNLKSKLGKRSNMALSARTSKQFAWDNETDHDFKLSLDHTLASGWKLFDQSRIKADMWYSKSTNSYQEENSCLKMSWTVPFHVPISRKKNWGTVKGKVYDKQTQSPLADVIIRSEGQIAVTDQNGEFIFPGLPAGPVYIEAGTSGIKENRVFYNKMPLQIMVKSQKTTSIDLPVIEPASFSGDISIYDFKTMGSEFEIISGSTGKAHWESSRPNLSGKKENNQELVKSGVIPNALVEMVNGARITRRLTDKKGRFSFNALVPGKYVMKIKGAQVPLHHRLEKQVFEIELSRSEHKEMNIKVLPIKRTMKMIPSVPVIIEQE